MLLQVVAAFVLVGGSDGGTAKSWTPLERPLSPRVTDSNLNTYELLQVGVEHDPVDFGIEWTKPHLVSNIRFGFASLGGRVYEPSSSASHLEGRENGVWLTIEAKRTIDYAATQALAPAQGRGTSWWNYRFPSRSCEAIRLRADAPSHTDPGFQCIALAEIQWGTRQSTERSREAAVVLTPGNLGWLEEGSNLADSRSGAVISLGKQTEVRWPRPLLVNCVKSPTDMTGVRMQYLAGTEWRDVSKVSRPGQTAARFIPVATRGLRIETSQPCTVHFDEFGRRYFDQVRDSRSDLLGDRFRHAKTRDLAEMQSLLLPIDFATAAMGRPSDLHETMAMWTGTFLMVENSEGKDPQTGAKLPAQDIDRWFAPIASKARFGTDWMHTHTSYLDGWLPSVVTEYQDGPLNYRQTVFVTAPTNAAYGNVAIVDVTNSGKSEKSGSFEYAMGRRPLYGNPWTPFSQDPLPTEYHVDGDGETVRNDKGEIVLAGLEPGKWGGTVRENHLAYSFQLRPGQVKRMCFFMPSVDAPIRKSVRIDPAGELAAFRAYWKGLFSGAAQLYVPEASINNLYKNLIAQSLIITLDGDLVRYGAYQYESYFGVEEGWPAVALAQYGFADTAKRISELMLAPEQMDKKNYHHQYRNGLDPWYAMMIGRLTGDMNWLQRQMPMIRSCADWTIQVTEANKDPKYGGTLPKHVYGGDIGMPAYSFYSNATCWRGLHDTAVALELLDRAAGRSVSPDVQRYRAAAEKYRERIFQLADQLVDTSTGLPFLPMSFDLDTPSGHREKEPAYPFLASHTTSGDTWGYVGNYWNLFAPLLLEVHLFDVLDKRESWIPNYIERRAGILTGLARFDLGLDHIYGKGYIESLLQQGRHEDFETAFYGLLANGMSRNLFSSPEVSGIFSLRTDNQTNYNDYDRERWNWFYRFIGPWLGGWQNQEGEPLSAGAGMALQILRMTLVREDDRADPPIGLRLLDGAPANWFENGRHVAVKDLRTFFGNVSFRVDSTLDTFSASLTVPLVPFTLRLPHPKGWHLTRVTLNGEPWKQFSANEIEIKTHPNSLKIVAQFSR